jgi:general secretion pathway protein G
MKNKFGKIAGSGRKAMGCGNDPFPIPHSPLPIPHSPLPTEAGFTLLELIITLGIIAILTAGAIPVAKNFIKREKEMELRRNLREIRKAIDAYHVACATQGLVGPLDRNVEDECYPPKLDILVEGIHPPNQSDRTIRFLRRIPKDPFTGNTEWGRRSIQDDPDSTSWGGQNVYDVYSLAPGIALDGKTQYKDW